LIAIYGLVWPMLCKSESVDAVETQIPAGH
jgi:hypothetical protein